MSEFSLAFRSSTSVRIALFLTAAAALAPYDLTWSRAIRASLGHGAWWVIVDRFERFGDGAVAALVLGAIASIDRSARRGAALAYTITRRCIRPGPSEEALEGALGSDVALLLPQAPAALPAMELGRSCAERNGGLI
ncbi:MAG: hypothetical protein R3F49_08045 [Planctomycetota bacterium]